MGKMKGGEWLLPTIGVKGNTNKINAMPGNISEINNVDCVDRQNVPDRRKCREGLLSCIEYVIDVATSELIVLEVVIGRRLEC